MEDKASVDTGVASRQVGVLERNVRCTNNEVMLECMLRRGGLAAQTESWGRKHTQTHTKEKNQRKKVGN